MGHATFNVTSTQLHAACLLTAPCSSHCFVIVIIIVLVRKTIKWIVAFTVDTKVIRAGFTLSRAMFRKKCGALQLRRQTLFFLEKNWRPFLVITIRVCQLSVLPPFCSSLSFHLGVAHFSRMQKFPAPFVGAMFGRTCWTYLNPPLKVIIKKSHEVRKIFLNF